MSDATPSSIKKAAKPWTDHEKLSLLFQIIEKAGTIPWATMDLPEGRTIKACSVMVDKEKAKVRKAKEAASNGEDVEEGHTLTTPKSKVRAAKTPFNLSKEIEKLAEPLLSKQKRSAATDEDATPTATAKKPKTPRKSKKTLQAEADAEARGEGVEEEDELVKAEVLD